MTLMSVHRWSGWMMSYKNSEVRIVLFTVYDSVQYKYVLPQQSIDLPRESIASY